MGQPMTPNVSSKFREGWTPVLAKDHPELHVMPDIDSKWSENIEVGGLLLCSNATETVEAVRNIIKSSHNDKLRVLIILT